MVRKIIMTTISAISFLSCDGDFKQGKCDEGFFEQNNFEGGSYCVPLAENNGVENTITDADNLNKAN